MIQVAHGLGLLRAADVVRLTLGTAAGDDGQAPRQQEVTAVAVLDLDAVTGGSEVVHRGCEDELHFTIS